MENNKEGLGLTIQFSPDEAQQLIVLTGTNNPQLQVAVIKASLLESKASAKPANIKPRIQLVHRMSEFGLRGDLAVTQEDANALDCPCDTLELPMIKGVVNRWAVAHEDTIRWVCRQSTRIHTYHYLWRPIQTAVSELLGVLQTDIAAGLQQEQDRLIASGVLTLTGIPGAVDSTWSTDDSVD